MVHIGFIPDGNRRWCRKNKMKYNHINLSDYWTNHFIRIINMLNCRTLEPFNLLTEISFYICSIENLKRKDNTKELIFELIRNIYKIMNNLGSYFTENTIDHFFSLLENLKLNILGDIEILPDDIQIILKKIQKRCKGDKYTLNLAIAYDFKKELLNYGHNYLPNYTSSQSDIDIVFRSGGEQRISGFFPTKIMYSELFFIEKLWPDVNVDDIKRVINDFNGRQRRFGR